MTENSTYPDYSQRISFIRAAKYACLSFPICTRFVKTSWPDIRTSKFPFLASIISPLALALFCFPTGIFRLGLYKYEDNLGEIGSYGFHILVGFTNLAFTLIAINLLIFAWIFFILWAFKRITGNTNIAIGTQRITYFSAFYQALFVFVVYLTLGLTHNSTSVTRVILCLIILAVAFLRVLAVFCGTFRESGKNIFISLLSCLACVDTWWVMYLMYHTRIST